MDRNQAKQELKGRLEDYLHSQGINTRKNFCCLNPDHADKHPSMNFDRKRNRVHCFSCNADYDIFSLIGVQYGLPGFKEQFQKACELFHIDVGSHSSGPAHTGQTNTPVSKTETTTPASKAEEPQVDYTDYFQMAHSHIQDTDYPARRGLSKDTVNRFHLGYDPAWRHPKAPVTVPTSPRLIIPTSRHSYIARDTRHTLTDKEKSYSKLKGGLVHLFNLEALERKEPAFIVEGEIDAMSIEELGMPAIALGTTSKVNALLDYLGEHHSSYPLIVALDADDAGRKAAKQLCQGLKEKGISFYRPDDLYTAGKDANDNLLKGRAAFKDRLELAQCEAINQAEEQQEAAREEYKKISAAAYIGDFINGIRDKVNTPAIDTGFTALNRVLDGGLYEGLYCVGAISSLGKTTLILQMADQIARAGQDVLIFSLEMSRYELIAKSISRLTYEQTIKENGDPHNAKTARGILSGDRWQGYSRQELTLIQKAVISYKAYADHLFIFEGLGDIGAVKIREAIKKHIQATGRHPVVMVDYLQILAPYDLRATDKQNTDKAVSELKRISRDYKIPVLAISSLNRQNYKEKIGMQAFKESGAIEYSSDVLIGLQLEGAGGDKFDATAAKRENPRHVELVILKQRNGRVGDKIQYDYYPMFNYFDEIGLKSDNFTRL